MVAVVGGGQEDREDRSRSRKRLQWHFDSVTKDSNTRHTKGSEKAPASRRAESAGHPAPSEGGSDCLKSRAE